MNQSSTFAERLKYIMEAKGLNNSSLAKICGINKSNITRYLSGEYEAKKDVIYRMAAKLDVDPQWLMGVDQDVLLDRVNSVDPFVLRMADGNLETAERIQDLVDGNRPEEAADLCKTIITGNSENADLPEITMIARAGKKMSPERRADMLKMLKIAFPEAFADDD